MAELLGTGGLLEEQREALLQAALWTGRALAVEKRSAEPEALQDCFRPPMALLWGASLGSLRAFASDPSVPAPPATQALHQIIGAG
jgi:hypothetical protein